MSQAIAEMVRTAVQRYSVQWDESRHPRGNAENAGEFTSKSAADSMSLKSPTDKKESAVSVMAESIKKYIMKELEFQRGRLNKAASDAGSKLRFSRVDDKYSRLASQVTTAIQRYSFDPNQKRDEDGRWASEGHAKHAAESANVILRLHGLPEATVDSSDEGHEVVHPHLGEEELDDLPKQHEMTRQASEILKKHGLPEAKLMKHGSSPYDEDDLADLKENHRIITDANKIRKEHGMEPLKLEEESGSWGRRSSAPIDDDELEALKENHEIVSDANKVLKKHGHELLKLDENGESPIADYEVERLQNASADVEKANKLLKKHGLLEAKLGDDYESTVNPEHMEEAEDEANDINKILAKHGESPIGIRHGSSEWKIYEPDADVDYEEIEELHKAATAINKKLKGLGLDPGVKIEVSRNKGSNEISLSHDLDEIEDALKVLSEFKPKKAKKSKEEPDDEAIILDEEPEKYSRDDIANIVTRSIARYAKKKTTSESDDEEPLHDFSCVMIELPSNIAEKVKAIATLIPEEDLAEDGIEETPHVTVKFGLHTDECDEVKSLVRGSEDFKISLGSTSLFENEDADVLKIDVDSEGLHELNKLISNELECTDTHPSYIPHVTIAYLKPGRGRKYSDSDILKGLSFNADEVVFSDKRRKETVIHFESGENWPFENEDEPEEPQSEKYSRSGDWITIGAHEGEDGKKHGGTPVRISNGKITSGPGSLKGESMDELHDKSRHHVRSAKSAHAASGEKTGRDLSPSEARALGSDRKVAMHQAAKQAAKGTGVKSHDVLRQMPSAHQHLTEQRKSRESAKKELRRLIGMDAGDLARHENNHKDHSTIEGWDTAARDIAEQYPDLNFDPDDTDTPAKAWDLLREGKAKHLALHDPEVAELAAEWLKESKPRRSREPGQDDGEQSHHRSGKRAKEVIPFSRMRFHGVNHYSGERWITIHPHGKEHDGVHVKIDDDGNITGGPEGLAKQGIKTLNDFGKHKKGDERSHSTVDKPPNTDNSIVGGEKQPKTEEMKMSEEKIEPTTRGFNKQTGSRVSPWTMGQTARASDGTIHVVTRIHPPQWDDTHSKWTHSITARPATEQETANHIRGARIEELRKKLDGMTAGPQDDRDRQEFNSRRNELEDELRKLEGRPSLAEEEAAKPKTTTTDVASDAREAMRTDRNATALDDDGDPYDARNWATITHALYRLHGSKHQHSIDSVKKLSDEEINQLLSSGAQ